MAERDVYQGRDPAPSFAPPQAPRPRALHRLNPLAKIATVVPAMFALVVAREALTPALFFALALIVIAIGATLTPRRRGLVFLGLPAAALVASFGFGAWLTVPDSGTVWFSIGPYAFSTGMWIGGLTTALRLTAIVALSLIAGLTSTSGELVRALVQQCRLPYRLAWVGLAAIRFVPRLGVELETIRAARRVRGIAPGDGVLARLRERFGVVLPLMISSIRHAERVGLAMDSRAFGAFPTRTERTPMRWRGRDTAWVACGWAVTVAVLVVPVVVGQ